MVAGGAFSLAFPAFWLLSSLAVSHCVYDRSGAGSGAWLRGVDVASARRVAVFHAGQDEASQFAKRALPAAEIAVFDFHGETGGETASLRRARALAETRAVPVSPDALPLENASLDLVLLVFAAHEIRSRDQRASFFKELARTLSPKARILVVEHLRDAWNLLAYGPGAFHFLGRAAWSLAFAAGGLTVLRETSLTPFVRVFDLGRER